MIEKRKNVEVEIKKKEEIEEIEGYTYCSTTKQRCLNDCIGGGPVLSSVN